MSMIPGFTDDEVQTSNGEVGSYQASFRAMLGILNGSVKANAGTVNKNIGADQHCFKCDEAGHLSRDCPNRHKLHCAHCNKKGHIKKNCWDIHGAPEFRRA